MWIPKWYWEAQIRQRDELERRVNRLELILLQDAKNKIASLKDEEAGTNKKGMYDICILERNYINSRDSLVQMSVELPATIGANYQIHLIGQRWKIFFLGRKIKIARIST